MPSERPSFRDFAHQKTPKNLAGPNWATCSDGTYFKDGKMNRDTHSEESGADVRMSSMGRTVRVEHFHFKDKS